MTISVSSVVEYPGAASSRLRTINSELNGASLAATDQILGTILENKV